MPHTVTYTPHIFNEEIYKLGREWFLFLKKNRTLYVSISYNSRRKINQFIPQCKMWYQVLYLMRWPWVANLEYTTMKICIKGR